VPWDADATLPETPNIGTRGYNLAIEVAFESSEANIFLMRRSTREP
jgi:hypothetical protein